MTQITGAVTINRPVEEVFDFVADERNEPRYNPRMRHVKQISAGPIGVGTRFRAEMIVLGRSMPMMIEYTVYERPRRLASSTHLSGMEIWGTLTFDPVSEGTRMRWSWNLQPRGVLRLLMPLLTRVGLRQEEAIWAGLQQYLEAQVPQVDASRQAAATMTRGHRDPLQG